MNDIARGPGEGRAAGETGLVLRGAWLCVGGETR